MIDRDISAAKALALLSSGDDSPDGITRRRFLQMVGWGVGGGALLGSLGQMAGGALLPQSLTDAWATPPVGERDGILVLVGMYGGNDGLNTVVPYGNSLYYSQRSNIAVPQGNVLAIDSQVGLHPNLPFLKGLYDQGQVAVVQGLGYANPDLSHFNSLALWMYGRNGGGVPSTGWLGRWADGLGGPQELFRLATIGTTVPLHLVGAVQRGTAVPDDGDAFGSAAADDLTSRRMFNHLRRYSATPAGRGPWHDMLASTLKGTIDVGQTVAPIMSRPFPERVVSRRMVAAARLVNADLGLRVIDVSGFGDFDNHDNQLAAHPDRLSELDAGLREFFTALDDRFRSRVTVMTFSEFGRTSYSNDSGGTDHGTANSQFVIGPSVRGGLYGAQPSLASLNRWDRLGFSVDFRSLYATVLDSWMGGGATAVLGASYENLGFMRTGPGEGTDNTPAPAGAPSDFVSMAPVRIYDSRSAVGTTRQVPLGAGTLGEARVAGIAGVPATGVTAVALNLTATDAPEKTYVTVYPTGEARPAASSLNVGPGGAAPNMVIAKVGRGGRIEMFNNAGSVNCVADVVGYFHSTEAAARLVSLRPARILDTRSGIGAPAARLSAGGRIDVNVLGVGGVPASGVDAVVVNVTAANPDAARSFVTVWPAGQPQPTASSLNTVAGRNVANLVIAKVGAGGRISIFNKNGATDVLADVMGYFAPGSGGRLMALSPARLLDTRNGTGAPTGPVGAERDVALVMAGRGGVPATGATAVVLNITAIGATANTNVTVWPDGEAKPATSNLNAPSGATVANLVFAKVAGGKVRVGNAAGTVQLVADIVGYFT